MGGEKRRDVNLVEAHRVFSPTRKADIEEDTSIFTEEDAKSRRTAAVSRRNFRSKPFDEIPFSPIFINSSHQLSGFHPPVPQGSTAFHSVPQRSTAFHKVPQRSTAFHKVPQGSR